MIVKYYKNQNLSYASRVRVSDLSKYEAFAEEEQRSVRLGDGSTTSVKTSVDNICDYVTIDDTRWFVVDYYYLNGRQVQLNLQRDVVGQFGLGNSYGKIERGYTDNVLKYRKELSLNEVLKERIPLKPTTNKYGNVTVSTHDNEMWGVMYFTKDSSKNKVSINIPAFSPAYEVSDTLPQVDVDYLNGDDSINFDSCRISFILFCPVNGAGWFWDISINFEYYEGQWVFSYDHARHSSYTDDWTFKLNITTDKPVGDDYTRALIEEYSIGQWVGTLAKNIIAGKVSSYTLPSTSSVSNLYGMQRYNSLYNGKAYYEDGEIYVYSSSTSTKSINGTVKRGGLFNEAVTSVPSLSYNYGSSYSCSLTATTQSGTSRTLRPTSAVTYGVARYSRIALSHVDAGILDIPMTQQFVDEPFCCLVMPLYDVTLKVLSSSSSKNYVVSSKAAFNVFNEVISYLSGQSGFLVDAQIYPYCPDLFDVQSELKDVNSGQTYPFFSIASTYFTTPCRVQLLPYTDVKKEYITRKYSIVSPEMSNKFSFNFYDYVNEFSKDGLAEDSDKNSAYMDIQIKTALKPFAIISSAVITRKNSLKGINYTTNLEGSQPSSNGFECSLATNAFEEYKRNNSNYQALFALDQQELQKNQEVERVNEATQFAMNMLTGTAFGAIAGAELGDSFWGNLVGAKSGGALAGGVAAATAIGVAGGVQLNTNDKMREYERDIQQQRFDLTIGTIKNLPNSINRISSFNEIIMRAFYYVVEVYECTDAEKTMVDNFISQYGYGIGVYDFFTNYIRTGWFIRGQVIKSTLSVHLHNILARELAGGIYIYE